MKNNVVLKSKDRNLFGMVISQEVKGGFLSVTELMKAFEEARKEHGWNEMNLSTLLQSKKTVERIFYLLNDKELVKVDFSTFKKRCEDEGITKVLKEYNVWKTTGKGDKRMVMCNPYIWFSIAVELNPIFYSKVIRFITDSLINDRIEACNSYRPMTDAIRSVSENANISKYAVAINQKIFGEHENGIRNTASAKELREIAELEKFLTKLIENGMAEDVKYVMKVIKNYKIQ